MGKATRIRNRTISSPAGSLQYSPSSMGSASTSVNMTRPPSGLSFGPMPVRERKRSLLDANMAQGLDQVRQSLPGTNHSGSQLTLDSSHLTSASLVNNKGGNSGSSGGSNTANSGSTEGKSILHMPFSVKQEPSDQSLIGLGLGAPSPSDAPSEETYHRKRTKSVDMYSSYMGSLNSFTPPPPQGGGIVPVSMDMTSNVTTSLNQGTSVQNWQPPDMALHLQMYQNNMHLNGLSSAMPPATMPIHMQMTGPVHPHQMSPNVIGAETNLYNIQNAGLSEHGQTLRHSLSHDQLGTGYGLLPQQATGAKAKSKVKVPKGTAKPTKVKGRSMSMGDALDPENNDSVEDDDTTQNEDKAPSGSEFEGSEIHGDPKARKQKLRYEGDQYTPQWVRNTGQAKEGFCDTCVPGKWLQLKNSAFWYHKQFFHGISSVSGKLFSSPMQTRQMEQEDVEGLCHQCNEWIPISNHKRQNSMLWYRHAHKCHIYHKPKTQGQSSNRSSFSAGQPLPTFSEGHPLAAQNGRNEAAPTNNF
ncbi:hypothetical protein BGZ46_004373 [Entomortierella lignicola]|nr:hypothetical protein BGZ46_004373 [Entomortierella lignicola]